MMLTIMEVYLVRHGIAAQRGTYDEDEQRPLIAKGRAKTIKVAQSLLKTGLEFDLILSSPLVRAYQTSEILQQAGLAKNIETCAFLKPNSAISKWLEWLAEYQLNNLGEQHQTETYSSKFHSAKIALVGHQPDLGNWTEMLLWGTIKGQIIVKKSGIIGLKLPKIGTPIARSTLFLHTAPKWLI